MLSEDNPVITSAWEEYVADYWSSKKDDFNLLLAERDGLVHHHFGIGSYDRSVLKSQSQERINEELHRLENAQVERIIDLLGDVGRHERVLDGGSGRGGTAIMIHQAFECRVDGVTISEYQFRFSQRIADQMGVSARIAFHHMNMLHTAFPSNCFQHVVTNETTMYVEDLAKLFAEFARVLEPGGRYVLATFCINEAHPEPSRFTDPIGEYYHCQMHTLGEYVEALAGNGFVPSNVQDFTRDAVPYFELRSHSSKKGVSEIYIQAYESGALKYMLIGSDYRPSCIS